MIKLTKKMWGTESNYWPLGKHQDNKPLDYSRSFEHSPFIFY